VGGDRGNPHAAQAQGRHGAGQALGALLKEYRIWGPRERLMEPALRRIAGHAGTAMQEAAGGPMVKGLRAALAGDPWDALLQLGLKLARGR
jgi:DNA polymerase-3 subunit delta